MTTRQFVVVAVDGPSGSGKSSVSKEVARRLGMHYLDTGAMYRATTWWCLHTAVALDDQGAVAASLSSIEVRMGTDPSAPTVHIVHPGEGIVDVTQAVREPRISAAVSAVATNLQVRADLRARQRQIIAMAAEAAALPDGSGDRAAAVAATNGPAPHPEGSGAGIVVEGRDITTVVAPDARVRVLLTASEESRLSRRAAQDRQAGANQSTHQTRDQVLRRDAQDATVAQFLTAADGVIEVDSSQLTFEATVQTLIALVQGARQ
ncbi:MAG: (d)CMP kinase [Actinomycetales bacterium]